MSLFIFCITNLLHLYPFSFFLSFFPLLLSHTLTLTLSLSSDLISFSPSLSLSFIWSDLILSLSLFQSSVLSTADGARQGARRDAVRVMGAVAVAIRDDLQPFLPKIMATISKRIRVGHLTRYNNINNNIEYILFTIQLWLQDNDSGTREVASETVGTLAKFITPPIKASGDHPLEVYFKPLFQVLSEQVK